MWDRSSVKPTAPQTGDRNVSRRSCRRGERRGSSLAPWLTLSCRQGPGASSVQTCPIPSLRILRIGAQRAMSHLRQVPAA